MRGLGSCGQGVSAGGVCRAQVGLCAHRGIGLAVARDAVRVDDLLEGAGQLVGRKVRRRHLVRDQRLEDGAHLNVRDAAGRALRMRSTKGPKAIRNLIPDSPSHREGSRREGPFDLLRGPRCLSAGCTAEPCSP